MKDVKDMIEVLRLVKERAPLVQCITNFVTVNDCANIILAAGGSPAMTQDIREVEEAVGNVQALVCNLGAVGYAESMILAGKAARRLGKPVVFDPVGVGGTRLRQSIARRLLEEVQVSVIRGNASEIRWLAGEQTRGSGVDASLTDAVTEENLPLAARLARGLAERTGSVVVVSGEIDLVTDGRRTAAFRNGCATMARITGSGCMLTALTGACCGAAPEDSFTAACAAVAAMGVCGELAERRRLERRAGNASFRIYLIDAVFNLTEEEFKEAVRCEIL